MKPDTSPEDKRTRIICTDTTRKRMGQIWQEANNGPLLHDLVTSGMPEDFANQLIAELEHFAQKDKDGEISDVEEFAEFYIFDDKGNVTLGDGTIVHMKDMRAGSYRFSHAGKPFAEVADTARYKQAILDVEFSEKVTRPHLFAVTVVGGGSGFTPDMQTASFVQWVNRRGTLIDLPEFPFMHLHRSGVDTKDIVRVLLTHVHADHVAGLFWLVVEYVKGTIDWPLYTTKTIFESMLRMMHAVTRGSIDSIRKIIPFHEIVPGEVIELPEGATLEAEYSLHSIPTIKTKFTYLAPPLDGEGRPLCITHSGDTLFDPDYTQMMVDEGLMRLERKEDLDTFVFTDGLIFHEVGGPPLHTVSPQLTKHLTEEQIGRLYAYHNSVDKLDVNLNVAEEGATLGLINTPEFETKEAMMILLDRSSFFSEVPTEKKEQMAAIAEKRLVKQGERIVAEGAKADFIYFIDRGVFDIYQESAGQNYVARMSRFDSFGEAGIQQMTRTASVFAQTEGVLYAVDGRRLKEIFTESYLDGLLEKQRGNRPFFVKHDLFRSLPPATQQLIANKSQKRRYEEGDTILNLGVTSDGFSILGSGHAEVLVPDPKTGDLKKVAELEESDFFGEMSLLTDEKTMARVVAQEPCEVFFIPGKDFHELMETNYQFSYIVTGIMQSRKSSHRERTASG